MNTILPALLLVLAAFATVECRCKGGFKECMKESGLTMDKLKELKDAKTVPDTPEFKNFLCCILKKKQMLKEDGESNPEVCKQHIDEKKEKLEKNGMKPEELKTCCDLGGADCSERAYNIAKCAVEKLNLPFGALLRGMGRGRQGKHSKEQE